MDSNVEIVAPVVGDIGPACALLTGMGKDWQRRRGWTSAVGRRLKTTYPDGAALQNNNVRWTTRAPWVVADDH